MFKQIKNVLAVASQIILSASVGLPGKVVVIAKYVALAIGLLDAVEKQVDKTEGQITEGPDEGQPTA